MLNLVARKRQENVAKAKEEREERRRKQPVNVSKAFPDPNIVEKKLEHERRSSEYLQAHPGTTVALSEYDRQRKELDDYFEQKRRVLMEKFISALQLGADVHFTEQKKILWKEYREEFLPHLLDTMHHIIIDNSRIVFATDATVIENEYFSRMPDVEEGSLHEKISLAVAVYLDDSKKRVAQAAEEQCAKLTLKSMNIMTQKLLDIENYWKEKTKRDVENFHHLKMQEMMYKVEEGNVDTPVHWSEHLTSPRRGRSARAKNNTSRSDSECPPPSDVDQYYAQAQLVHKNIYKDTEILINEIRNENFSCRDANVATSRINGKYEDEYSNAVTEVEQEDIQKCDAETLKTCYSSLAEMRRMNLEAEMFLQRMNSISANLDAEYNALAHSLSLHQVNRLDSNSSDNNTEVERGSTI